ncbi:16S rRNA (cytidine(1402)-2'-O)-methyltransferase [Poseidonocella sedimentorum]|uniref:Ribosomal RNA small subunit methyltransferase I n=1 Tax=Poseidonocella sedimentorum TaxID=871652 RepID=A0A1I6DS99_9RHOB|nr:16S rRNA (cytidine(1402)-2'-O)-methyltransferase [Poseidonocella sedimentorum]SFR08340.1 16S rRNA (cytidine1402-2'-O)-methyltransferase [Poseidonocella sedimentorum]
MWNEDSRPLAAGLYLVSVPIGTARDITLRALDTLAKADVLAAEDTRSLRRLMEIHGVKLGDRRVIAYHDRSGPQIRDRLLAEVTAGKSVAYASEAGTPLVADPGFQLVRAARLADLPVTGAPGPSAAIAALAIAGLPTDRFLFVGFLPNAEKARQTELEALAEIPATLVFYESPKRVAAMLRDAAAVLGPAREAAVCRELTKRFEDVRRAPLGELADAFAGETTKGEIVVLIGRGEAAEANAADIASALEAALATMSVRDAADTVATAFGHKRREVYQMALELSK